MKRPGRESGDVQINQFTGGLNTEFNPLQMPPNVSIDEQNMEITLSGSRKKRLGFIFENNHQKINSGVQRQSNKTLGKNLFFWENVGNDANKTILVVQIANHLAFYEYDSIEEVSRKQIYTETLSQTAYETSVDFAAVDGFLVCASNRKQIIIYEYKNGEIIKSEKRLLIRDLFGVQTIISNVDYTSQLNINRRPSQNSTFHNYNLRNQGWWTPIRTDNGETVGDPLSVFITKSNRWPSNSDTIAPYRYADPNDADNRTVERYFVSDAIKEAPPSSPAPKGHFIIDALERGASRRSRESRMQASYSVLGRTGNAPNDTTPGGATVVAEFAGRAWYGGFSGDLVGGDSHSPRMNSYLLFSQLVQDASDINSCYQKADPTDIEDPDLVDTDGGFIRLSGAFGIKKMVNIYNSLFVFAENGVWRVSGDVDGSFTATSYQVDKVTNFGTISKNSVVVSNNSIFYWSDDGIILISRNEFGTWDASDITERTIQSLYNDIPDAARKQVSGVEDSYQKKIRWVYSDVDSLDTNSKEIVLDLNYNAFTYNQIESPEDEKYLVTDIIKSQPFKQAESPQNVFVDGQVVVDSNGVDVTVSSEVKFSSFKETFYLVITSTVPTIEYSFGLYSSPTFLDWGETGYEAFIVTGAFTGGEPRNRKQAPYLNVYLERTENGFNPDLTPLNPSSCFVSSQWDWTNSERASKWSKPRQAYRIKNLYMPVSAQDTYDTGRTVIETRNKIRGFGKSVSFKFESEPGKNMHIHGWAFTIQMNKKE